MYQCMFCNIFGEEADIFKYGFQQIKLKKSSNNLSKFDTFAFIYLEQFNKLNQI